MYPHIQHRAAYILNRKKIILYRVKLYKLLLYKLVLNCTKTQDESLNQPKTQIISYAACLP